MLVKLEPSQSTDALDLDVESNLFREQLFGYSSFNSDISESGSEEDALSRLAFSHERDTDFDAVFDPMDVSISNSSSSCNSSPSSNGPLESYSLEINSTNSANYIAFEGMSENDIKIEVHSPHKMNGDILRKEITVPIELDLFKSNVNRVQNLSSLWDILNEDDVKPELQELQCCLINPDSCLNAEVHSNPGTSSPCYYFSSNATTPQITTIANTLGEVPVRRTTLAPKLSPLQVTHCHGSVTQPTVVEANTHSSSNVMNSNSLSKAVDPSVLPLKIHSSSADFPTPNKIIHANKSPTYSSKQVHFSKKDVLKLSNKEELELLAMKRRERMIKNRESASLSRKKKKDYLTSLENRVKELDMENINLRKENGCLKSHILELEREMLKRKNVRLPSKKTSAVLLGVFGCFVFNLLGRNISTEVSHNQNIFDQSTDQSSFSFNSRSILSLPMMSNKKSRANIPAANHSHHVCPQGFNTSENKVIYDNFLYMFNNSVMPSLLVDGHDVFNFGGKNDEIPFGAKESIDEFDLNRSDKIPIFQKKKRFAFRAKNKNNKKISSVLQSIAHFNDTNYLVSLEDHVFLPANEQNISCRPKLSLLLSTVSQFGGQPSLMQIDCLVTHTQLHDWNSYPTGSSKDEGKFIKKNLPQGFPSLRP